MCVICGKNDDSKKIKGLDGAICDNCYSHLTSLLQGDVKSAHEYFDNMTYATEDGAIYVMNAFEKNEIPQYIAPDDDSEDDDAPATSYELLSAIHDDLSSIKQNVSFLATVVLIGLIAAGVSVFIISAIYLLR